MVQFKGTNEVIGLQAVTGSLANTQGHNSGRISPPMGYEEFISLHE
jgi:hypothetical protein